MSLLTVMSLSACSAALAAEPVTTTDGVVVSAVQLGDVIPYYDAVNKESKEWCVYGLTAKNESTEDQGDDSSLDQYNAGWDEVTRFAQEADVDLGDLLDDYPELMKEKPLTAGDSVKWSTIFECTGEDEFEDYLAGQESTYLVAR
ncbi:hypothetical protein [Cryobacterium sp. Y57]|uniref:hypothetical protein n=1 Tax=Cryobacterium sp. Y57 TaxID=2048287 RepID=UPI000CE3EA29|nr:hypothetical protein [Cryobacterium sp. Y57]